MRTVVRKLLNRPFVFINIIAETYLRVYIISEQVYLGLIMGDLGQGRELEQSFLDTAIVVHMNGVLEHVVYKIGVGLNEVIEHLQYFDVFLLFFIKGIESHVIAVYFNRLKVPG